jgi:hypothetical protein
MPGYFLNSAIVFGIAKKASLRAAANSGTILDDVLTAIVFSVGGAEAFLNEAIELATTVVFMHESDPDKISAFGEMGKQIEESRGSIELKYQTAKWIFSGKAFNRGASPYQDFALLISVRNAIIHYKLLDKIELTPSGDMQMNAPAIIGRLESKDVLSDAPLYPHQSWLQRIATPEMATWSCATTAQMVSDFEKMLPKGFFKSQIELLTRSFVTSVPGF